MDKFSAEKRSLIMSSVKAKNTKPELLVRSLFHRNGFRFRLHRDDLPGIPDIVLPRFKTVIFVHGCFWHGHDCSKGKRPSTNVDFWNKKLNGNIARDELNYSALRDLGWNVELIWECEVVPSTLRLIDGLRAL